ncbi:hypothetical protein V8E51_001719 [Hyaloscypha variabilis]
MENLVKPLGRQQMDFCDDSESNMSCPRPPAGLPLKHSSPASQDARPQSSCQEISPSEEFGLFRLPVEVQAMQLSSVTINVRLDFPQPEVLPVLELAFNSFPLLRDLKLCVFQTPNFRGKQVPRLQYEVKSLKDQLKLTSMVTYVKGPQRRRKEIGLECRWRGDNGIDRRFVMEKKIERNEDTPEGTGPIPRDSYYC